MDNIETISHSHNILNSDEKYSKWNTKIENVVADIYNKSLLYKSQHMKEAQNSYNKYSFFMIAVIIITPLAGSISVLKIILDSDSYLFSIFSSILSFSAGIIVSVVKFAKYDEIGNSHKTATARYISLLNNVKRQLSLYRKDRISSNEYLQWLTNAFDELFISSPLLHADSLLDNIDDEKLIINEEDEECEKIKKDEDNEYKNIKIENKEEKDIESLLSTRDFNIYNDGMMTYQLNRLRHFTSV